jgi:hypothetical protein
MPVTWWAVGLIAGVVGFMWVRKRSSSTPATGAAGPSGTPTFTQQQEVQDFQIFSSLTGAQQASDLNFLSEVAGLFAGGSSTQTPTAPTTPSTPTTPSPPSTGTAPPTTQPANHQGYGVVQTAQGPMVWLGVNQAGAPIYNVGGGAPVYFGNTAGLATGAQYEKPGYDIYTPVGYENMVAGNTAVLGQPYVG